MKLSEAQIIAQEIKGQLVPYCERIEIAGSIRRQRPQVKDIEIVCIPKPYETGLFANGIASIIQAWPKVKGELQYGKCKYTQRQHPAGIKVDIFFAEPGNWGLIYAIRTGSANYSHQRLAVTWSRQGFKSIEGYLYKNGRKVITPEEEDVFRIIGLPFEQPERREM